jgi:cell division protein FtsB
MSEEKIMGTILPRFVFGKDRITLRGYIVRACHPDLKGDYGNFFPKIKAEFEWPREFADTSCCTYPDCYGLYRLDHGRYFLLKFQDEGYEESNRPHTVGYEGVLCDICDIEDGDIHDTSLFLASLLDPRAWLEPDVASFAPVNPPDGALVSRIEEWLEKNTGKLFVHTPNRPPKTPQPLRSVAGTPRIPAFVQRQRGSHLLVRKSYLLAGFILLFCLAAFSALSVWRYSVSSNTQNLEFLDMQKKYDILAKKNGELNRGNAELSQEVERLKDRLDRIHDFSDLKKEFY